MLDTHREGSSLWIQGWCFFLTFGTITPQKFLFTPTLDCCQPLTFGIVLQAGTRFPPQSQETSFSVKETNSSQIVNLLQNFCFEYAYMPYPHQVDWKLYKGLLLPWFCIKILRKKYSKKKAESCSKQKYYNKYYNKYHRQQKI